MKNRGGFTIVETIITLAVSSVLFVTVMLLFSGRQGRIEFYQGLRDVDVQIRDIANDVRNGYIPTVSGGFSCSFDDSGVVSITSGSSGANNCIFAGKAIFIDSEGGQIITYTLAGRQKATNLVELTPKIIANGTGVDTSESYKLPAGLKLVKSDKTILNGYLIGLFFDLSKVGLTGSPVIATAKKPAGDDYAGRQQTIESIVVGSGLVLSPITDAGIKLCFKSGTSDQYGNIIINKTVNGISTSVELDKQPAGCAEA